MSDCSPLADGDDNSIIQTKSHSASAKGHMYS